MINRYDTSDNPEGRNQSGSNDTMLFNNIGIAGIDKMDDAECDLLRDTQDKLFDDIKIN